MKTAKKKTTKKKTNLSGAKSLKEKYDELKRVHEGGYLDAISELSDDEIKGSINAKIAIPIGATGGRKITTDASIPNSITTNLTFLFIRGYILLKFYSH